MPKERLNSATRRRLDGKAIEVEAITKCKAMSAVRLQATRGANAALAGTASPPLDRNVAKRFALASRRRTVFVVDPVAVRLWCEGNLAPREAQCNKETTSNKEITLVKEATFSEEVPPIKALAHSAT